MRSCMSIASVCVAIFAAPLLAQTDDCLSHFQESGSIFRGKVLETYMEFSGIDKKTALYRLQSQLPGTGFSIISVDAEAGTIKSENQAPNARPFPIEFTVSPTASGVRVRMWLKMNAGQMPMGGTKPAICETLRLAAVDPPPPPEPANLQENANPDAAGAQARAPADGDDTDKPLSADAITKLTGGSSDEQSGDKEADSTHKKKQQKALTNDDIVKLVKAELGDQVVIDKINSSPGDKLDTSTDALIRLKKAGVSKAVIDAIIKRGDE
jgi:hypothetical protein